MTFASMKQNLHLKQVEKQADEGIRKAVLNEKPDLLFANRLPLNTLRLSTAIPHLDSTSSTTYKLNNLVCHDHTIGARVSIWDGQFLSLAGLLDHYIAKRILGDFR